MLFVHHHLSIIYIAVISSQVAEVEMPRLCQDARGLLPMALLRAPDTAVTAASGAEKRTRKSYQLSQLICPTPIPMCENKVSTI